MLSADRAKKVENNEGHQTIHLQKRTCHHSERGFMQYYFELADGAQCSYPKLTARGAERRAKQIIDDMTNRLSSEWSIPCQNHELFERYMKGYPFRGIYRLRYRLLCSLS
jgi:hypothetical protein